MADITENQKHVKLAYDTEIRNMSDAQSIARIDELKEAAVRATDEGYIGRARAYWSNACDIALSNYVGTDVFTEYAGFLDEHDLPGYAELYLDEHRKLMDMLAEHGLPKPGYDDRLRAENAHEELDKATSMPRVSLASEVRNAWAAAEHASRGIAYEPRRPDNLGPRS